MVRIVYELMYFFVATVTVPYLGPVHKHFRSHWYSCFGFWAIFSMDCNLPPAPENIIILLSRSNLLEQCHLTQKEQRAALHFLPYKKYPFMKNYNSLNINES